jgi:PAS domain S-box-containing protein
MNELSVGMVTCGSMHEEIKECLAALERSFRIYPILPACTFSVKIDLLRNYLDRSTSENDLTLLAYGMCHPQISALLAEYDDRVVTLKGSNCYEMFLGSEKYAEYHGKCYWMLNKPFFTKWRKEISAGYGVGTNNGRLLLLDTFKKLVYVRFDKDQPGTDIVESFASTAGLDYEVHSADTTNLLRLLEEALVLASSTSQAKPLKPSVNFTNESRIRTTLENIGEIIYGIDAHTKEFIFVSPQVKRILGYNEAEFMDIMNDRVLAPFYHQDYRKQVMVDRYNFLLKCLNEGMREPYEAEFSVKHKDGYVLWVKESIYPSYSSEGIIESFVGKIEDITNRKQAEEALERRNRELSSLHAIASTAGRSLELEQVLGDTLRTVLDLMGLKAGWIFLKEDQSDKLTLLSHLGLPSGFVQEESQGPLADCLVFDVLQRKETLITENASECPRLSRSLPEGETLACHASVPLLSKDEVVGVMNLASESYRPFSPEDLNLLTAIGHQVGVAIENARLFKNTEQKSSELQEAYDRLRSLYEDLKAEREKTKTLKKALDDKFGLGNIVGKNPKMQAIYELIEDISQSDSTVLIQGESGTGKELIARATHLLSPRKERPFVVANCSAYAQTLLESELFGHEKGAFTGALRRKQGRFELADGGTIFLDEIGEIPPATQLLLLRVLQEKRFERVGGEDTIKVDVRVIAATNRNLAQEMKEGRFREDLYYRLNVIPIVVPPLRERKNDIPLLAKRFLEIYSTANSKAMRGFSEEVMQIFLDFDWPGNVRELQNVVEYAVILAKGDMITELDLPQSLKETFPRIHAELASLKDTEKSLILKVLQETEGNKYQTAKRLGITRSTLYGKMRKHGIVVPGKN